MEGLGWGVGKGNVDQQQRGTDVVTHRVKGKTQPKARTDPYAPPSGKGRKGEVTPLQTEAEEQAMQASMGGIPAAST